MNCVAWMTTSDCAVTVCLNLLSSWRLFVFLPPLLDISTPPRRRREKTSTSLPRTQAPLCSSTCTTLIPRVKFDVKSRRLGFAIIAWERDPRIKSSGSLENRVRRPKSQFPSFFFGLGPEDRRPPVGKRDCNWSVVFPWDACVFSERICLSFFFHLFFLLDIQFNSQMCFLFLAPSPRTFCSFRTGIKRRGCIFGCLWILAV